MASCNFLPPRLAGEHVNKNSDTVSEASETGTTTSGWTSNWDAREDLQDFIAKLGLKEVADLYQERFRVDRRKLEQMLTNDNYALVPADVFFERVMEETDTYITWPNKLKIGAKSKKDPHVRIAGRPQDVQAARERILTILDTRSNRVTMKMDVSYTDHSHIIGKGGLSIKRVMEETHCHVHFPDSNRSNANEKSNQVSISGCIEGVECARSRVRELTPLVFGFELPIMSEKIDLTCPYIIKIQEQYKVQVMFKTRPKLHANLVLVKGVEWEVQQAKQATRLLMEYMCEKLANQIPVQMSMEISPHHYQIVLGKNHANLKAIMQHTGCQIIFPDAQDPNIPSLRKSHVSITGNIHNVYKARQLLVGSLPIIIIFDLPEDCPELKIKQEQLADIENSLHVMVTVKTKANKTTKACVIKGIERNAANIYKARSVILGEDDTLIKADIPSSYHLPSSPNAHAAPASSTLQPNNELPTPTPNNQQYSPLLSPLISPNWQYPSTPSIHSPAPFVGMVHQPQFMFNVVQPTGAGSSGYHSGQSSQFCPSSLSNEHNNETRSYSISGSSSISVASSPRTSISPGGGYRHYSESSPSHQSDLSSIFAKMNLGEYHGTTVEKTQEQYCSSPFDMENKRLSGFRAMQSRPNPGVYRTPTGSWSGYGISHTTPAGGVPIKKDEATWVPNNSPIKPNTADTLPLAPSPNNYRAMGGNSPNLNLSNVLDYTPAHIRNRVMTSSSADWSDLSTMLTAMQLEHYIHVFNKHEIDLATFATLTEKDLIEIGITTFGARRRLLLAISEFNKRRTPFSAAPGAERRNSLFSNTPNSRNN